MRGFHLTDTPFHKWRQFYEQRKISLPGRPLFRRSQKFFAMGSCFAAEIRGALSAMGVTVLPAYETIPLDDLRYQIDTIPAQMHMNYYNSFSIRQEFERCLGLWEQTRDDCWEVARSPLPFQDPYRRLVFGKTREDLFEAIDRINRAVREGVERADVFLFTLGMTEVFRKHNDGRVACQKPAYLGGGGEAETALHLSTFQENYDNMARVAEIIHAVNPAAHIVLTVSPVPLERTFSGRDIYTANMEGKSTLRAVAGELARCDKRIVYLPSYELVTGMGEAAFRADDLRHVRPEVVNLITRAFVAAYFEPAETLVPAS